MTHYVLYVNNHPQHTCEEWFVVHDIGLYANSIKEWDEISIYTAMDGVPLWGEIPEQMQEKFLSRRLKSMRTRYLQTVTTTERKSEKLLPEIN